MNEGEWIQVENYPTLITAELAKSRLDLGGIDSEIFDGETANMNWLYTNALGGVKLMVRREDYDFAHDILESESQVGDFVVSEADELMSSSVYCSKCHSKNIKVKSPGPSVRGFSIRILLGKLLGLKKPLLCRNCGNQWMG